MPSPKRKPLLKASLALALVLPAALVLCEPAGGGGFEACSPAATRAAGEPRYAAELEVGFASFECGKIIEDVATAHDDSQRYALYLPSGYAAAQSSATTWPVLFVLDPRGRAVEGIERFLPAAERHGYIVLSSYQSRSDAAASITVDAMKALSREAQVRYRVDLRRLYLAGMSGTAHASWRLAQAMGEHAAGVVGCVGGVQEETQGPPGDAHFAYYGITSRIDFNYQETLRLEEHMLASGIDHRIDFFEGRHGWPAHEHTNRALDWMQLQAVKRGLAPADALLVEDEHRRTLAALAAATDPLEKLRRRRDLVRDFEGLRAVDDHREAIRRLESGPELKARRALARLLAKRERTYFAQRLGPFLATITNRAERVPTLEAAKVDLQIDELRTQAAKRDDPVRADSAQRILESLHTTVAFYLPEQFESRNDLNRAARALEIAIAIFPRGVRTQWRLASVYARAGLTEQAFEALRSATAFGNVDLERLQTDPTWEPLRGTPEWGSLLEALSDG